MKIEEIILLSEITKAIRGEPSEMPNYDKEDFKLIFVVLAALILLCFIVMVIVL